MSQPDAPFVDFTGPWVGQTQGADMPAHLWQIRQSGRSVWVSTSWEGEQGVGGMSFQGILAEEGPAFTLVGRFTATLVDPQHFIIPGWDTNDVRGNVGPDYDVVFSRPGIAELTAAAVYARHRPFLADALPKD
jgi:hypothetical protein